MRIQHNIAALNSHRQLTNNNSGVAKNLEKLSSGYRINRAGDDAAGLAISEKMRAQITGLNTASKNAQDGISLVQTAEGALTEVHSMLNRMTELAGQAANGTYQDEVDRENAMEELNSLRDEIDRISEGTNFNGIKLLDGSMGTGTTGVDGTQAITGANAANFTVSGVAEGVKVAFSSVVKTAATGLTAAWNNNQLTFTFNAANGDTFTQDDVDAAIRNASGAPEAGKGIKVTLKQDVTFTADSVVANAGGAVSFAAAKAVKADTTSTNGKIVLSSTKAGVDARTMTIAAAGSIGVNVAGNTGNVTMNLDANKSYTSSEINNMLSKAGANMTFKFDGTMTGTELAATSDGSGAAGVYGLGAGTTSTDGTGLASGGGLSLQIGDTADSFNQLNVEVASMSTASLGIDALDIGSQDGAKAAVDIIKKAINTVSSTRGDLGAIQNRLEHTINNLGVTAENMTAAESRIRDVDMAQEMMTYTKNNILTQASQAMLAQANQLPQGVLQLLQ